MNVKSRWGFLRETREKAEKEEPDSIYGLHKTGLEDYLKVIFPEINDWIHDREIGIINGVRYKFRPDYRSESLKMIIEFDGLLHYKNIESIDKDSHQTELYKQGGYTVVRIPYFIQLTKETIFKLFGREVKIEMFPTTIPSMMAEWKNTPAFMCPGGIKRMAKELLQFPEQMEVNLKALKHDEINGNAPCAGYSLLKNAIEEITKG